MYAQHMARQVSWLSSERLLKLAIDRPDFKAVKQYQQPRPVEEFSENLKVQPLKGVGGPTDQITVTYTDLDPAVAPLAVKAVIRTYDEHFKGADLEYVNRKKDTFWEDTKKDAESTIKAMEKQIEECVGESGWGTDDLSTLIHSQQEEQRGFEREAAIYKLQLETLKSGKAPELSVDDIARVDGGAMLSKLQRRDAIKTELAKLRLTLGSEHHSIIMLRKELLGDRAGDRAARRGLPQEVGDQQQHGPRHPPGNTTPNLNGAR